MDFGMNSENLVDNIRSLNRVVGSICEGVFDKVVDGLI